MAAGKEASAARHTAVRYGLLSIASTQYGLHTDKTTVEVHATHG